MPSAKARATHSLVPQAGRRRGAPEKAKTSGAGARGAKAHFGNFGKLWKPTGRALPTERLLETWPGGSEEEQILRDKESMP